MTEINIARRSIQAAINGEEDETTRDYYHFHPAPINAETIAHDRPELKSFGGTSGDLYYCANCSKFLTEDKVALHERIHKLGGRIL